MNLMNRQEKGAFGEYVFSHFLTDQKIEHQKVNRFGRDFEIFFRGKKHNIDLKTSSKNQVWTNKKYGKFGISYDVVFIEEKNNSVVFYPDVDSPLYDNYYAYKLGNLSYLKNKFNGLKTDFKGKKEKQHNPSHLIKNKIKNQGKNIRVLYRIDTHNWKGFPDNLPGSYKKYDATVFLRLKFDWNTDEPNFEQGYLLLTKDLDKNKYPLIEAQQRQRNKGIKSVINWSEFKNKFDHLCFHDENKLLLAIKNI
tara:strand:- start:174 stop:926 length:753 start_codon:yes stop_codon:yes gene_type:complete